MQTAQPHKVIQKGKALLPAADATFLQARTGLPLKCEVLKETIMSRHAFMVSPSHEAWAMLAHLAGNVSEPKYYQRRPSETRRLLRSLVEKAVEQGEFETLYRLYDSGLLSLNLSREFCYSANRETAYLALLEENGGAEPTKETYHRNCLDSLWQRKGEKAGIAGLKPRADGRPYTAAAPIEEKKKRKVDGSWGKEKLKKEDGKKEDCAKPDPKNEFVAAFLEDAPDKEDVVTDFDLTVDPDAANDDGSDSQPMAIGMGAGGQETGEKRPMAASAKEKIVHKIDELRADEWSPESEVEPGAYSKAVISCWVYFNRELAEVSDKANVTVRIKAGKHETAYKTDAATALADWLPEYEITLDIANRDGKYAAPHGRPQNIEQNDVPDIIREIISSVA